MALVFGEIDMQQIVAKERQLDTLKGVRSLDISAVSGWLAELKAALDSDARTLYLDMADVEKIDTACLQALVVFVLSARDRHFEVVWQATSVAFRAAAEDLGLDKFLGVANG